MRTLFVSADAFSAHALHELIVMLAEIMGVCALPELTFNRETLN
jgi:methionyl-tRNA formyltransferase